MLTPGHAPGQRPDAYRAPARFPLTLLIVASLVAAFGTGCGSSGSEIVGQQKPETRERRLDAAVKTLKG